MEYNVKNWKEVPIPPLMKHLKIDARGYPVPHSVKYDKQGVPRFTVNDNEVVLECLLESRCHVCGFPLEYDRWLIGGPLSAFHPNGAFADGPVHKQCGEYALKVCPYLAAANYMYNPNKNISPTQFDGVNTLLDKTQTPNRVPFFVFVRISGFRIGSVIERNIIPNKPYLETEFYFAGNRITKEEAINIIKTKHES